MELEIKNALQQKQALSQRMIQSVRILEMGADEVETFLREMAEQNPMIDLEDADREQKQELKNRWEWERQNDYQNADYYSSDRDQEGHEEYAPGNTGELLEDYLMAQLVPLCGKKYKKSVFYYLVKSLDGRGYLDLELREAAELGMEEEKLLDYLSMLQACEPAGIGARDMREALKLQMVRLYPQEKLALEMIENYLEHLAKRRFSVIAKELGCSVEAVKEAAELIAGLNPKPGNGFADREHLPYVYPDVFVVRHEDGFEVLVNESESARMKINPYYLKLLEQEETGRETVEYIKNKLEQVKWAVRCVDQRNQTLRNVAIAIVQWQREYFEKGAGMLAPMRLADISKETGLHISTVSRAIRNKYIQCAYGVFPMSYFFSKSLGENTTENVKSQLKKIIDQEDKKKPYSDQKLAQMLEQKGFPISRRTVAKYRAEMGILGAGGRKE